MAPYDAVLTTSGVAKVASSIATGTDVIFSHIAFGDGGGSTITPTSAMTALVNEVWRGSVIASGRDTSDATLIYATTLIPFSTGPFTIREVGLFTSDGQLFAVGAFPDSVKPPLSQGAAIEVLFRFMIKIASGATVSYTISSDNYTPIGRYRVPFMAVKSATVTVPPATPASGDVYLVPAGATGAWTGYADRLVQFLDGFWINTSPPLTTIFGIEDSDKYMRRTATGWVVISLGGSKDFLDSVRVATTGNIALSGLPIIDGYQAVAGNRILVRANTVASQNGVYLAAAGAWTRASDATVDLNSGAELFVENGATWSGTGHVLATPDPIVVGTTAQSWVMTSSSNLFNASFLSTGTISDARLPARIGAAGATITSWNAIVTPGFYSSVASATAVAPNATNDWYGYHIPWSAATTYATQIVMMRDEASTSLSTNCYRRDKTANVWGAWYRVSLSLDEMNALYLRLGDIIPEAMLPDRIARAATTGDWNAALMTGTYHSAAGTVVNSPDNSVAWLGSVDSINDGIQHVTQTVHAYALDTALNHRTFRRSRTSGAWGAWSTYPSEMYTAATTAPTAFASGDYWKNTATTTVSGVRAGGTARRTDAGWKEISEDLAFTGQNTFAGSAGIGNTGIGVTAAGASAAANNVGSQATIIGATAGSGNTGARLTAVGNNTAFGNTGTDVTAVGADAAMSNTASGVTAFGYAAAQSNSGIDATVFGKNSGKLNTGSNLTAIGIDAGSEQTGSYVAALGDAAAFKNIGSRVTVSGFGSGLNNVASNLTAAGSSSGQYNAGDRVSAFGTNSGYNNAGASSSFLGAGSGYGNNGFNLTAAGNNAAYGNIDHNVTAIGSEAMTAFVAGPSKAVSALAGTNRLTVTGHGFGAVASVFSVIFTGTPPPPLLVGTQYKATAVNANTIEIINPQNGTITGPGSCTVAKQTLDRTGSSAIGIYADVEGPNEVALGGFNIVAVKTLGAIRPGRFLTSALTAAFAAKAGAGAIAYDQTLGKLVISTGVAWVLV
jgi:hypothetical protein